MNFSQRIGIIKNTKSIQLDSIDNELRTGLWNIIKLFIIDRLSRNNRNNKSSFDHFCINLWHSYFKMAIDEIPENDYKAEQFIRNRFFDSDWNEVYDIIEFIVATDLDETIKEEFSEQINNVLIREFSGFRLIQGIISPISNKFEFQELNTAITQIENFTSLKGANIHLTNALNKLSDKKNPDFRNSIKESISAIETTCRIITGESTLGKALNSLEQKGIKIDNQLKSGFDKIYSYTNNDKSGIRHAIMESHNTPDFEDAKYMLIICSSFINYLIGKCRTFNIEI